MRKGPKQLCGPARDWNAWRQARDEAIANPKGRNAGAAKMAERAKKAAEAAGKELASPSGQAVDPSDTDESGAVSSSPQ